MFIGSAQGGIQAISRLYFTKLVPKEKSSKYFRVYSGFEKFVATLGPILVAVIIQIYFKSF